MMKALEKAPVEQSEVGKKFSEDLEEMKAEVIPICLRSTHT